MPMPEPVLLEDSDAFVEGLYHLLWSKNQSGEPCPDILVPDVVIYKYQIPAYWYFTGSDGRLKRKNKAGIVNKKIHADFTRGARGDGAVCTQEDAACSAAGRKSQTGPGRGRGVDRRWCPSCRFWLHDCKYRCCGEWESESQWEAPEN